MIVQDGRNMRAGTFTGKQYPQAKNYGQKRKKHYRNSSSLLKSDDKYKFSDRKQIENSGSGSRLASPEDRAKHLIKVTNGQPDLQHRFLDLESSI